MSEMGIKMESRVTRINEALQDAPFRVSYTLVKKNNGVELDAYCLKDGDLSCSPTIYYGDWFQQSDDEIAEYLRQMYKEHAFRLDTEKIMTRDYVLANVVPAVVGNGNKQDLDDQNVVYKEYLDMLVYYRLKVQVRDDQTGSAKVNTGILAMAGVTEEELDAAAFKNVAKDIQIVRMSDLLADMLGDGFGLFENELPMYVISNSERAHGAGLIACRDALNSIAAVIGGDAFVIPSSVHELIAVPTAMMADGMELAETVAYVNETQVTPEERLTNSVYLLSEEGEISIFEGEA